MTAHEYLNPPLATLEQASAVLQEANALTTLYATGPNVYELEEVSAPAAIAAHFQSSGSASIGAVTSVRVLQEQDRHVRGEPKQEGAQATVSFLHWDYRDQQTGYVTQVEYLVNPSAAGAAQPIARRVTNYEVGPHKSAAATWSRLVEQMIERPEHMRAQNERPTAPGNVTAAEANQILHFLERLKLDAADTVNPEFMAMLRSANIDPCNVSLDRRLINHESATTPQVVEIFSRSLQRRFIVAEAGDENVANSHTLEEKGVPFLHSSDVRVEGLHMWEVPAGSTTLHSVIGNVRQNPDRYGEILSMAQDVLQKIADSGLSVAETDRPLLERLVIVPDAEKGFRVVLAPPVRLSSQANSQGGV